MGEFIREVAAEAAASAIPWDTVLPVAGSVVAALIAGFFAWRAQRTSADADRARRLEEATSGRRRETYEPMIEKFSKLIDPRTRGEITDDDLAELMRVGSTWLSIYGSDKAVTTFHWLMQAAYHDAPGPITVRLYAEFVLAARKDIGLPSSSLTAVELLGMRLRDLYTDPDTYDALSMPFKRLCKREGWTPPWKAAGR